MIFLPPPRIDQRRYRYSTLGSEFKLRWTSLLDRTMRFETSRSQRWYTETGLVGPEAGSPPTNRRNTLVNCHPNLPKPNNLNAEVTNASSVCTAVNRKSGWNPRANARPPPSNFGKGGEGGARKGVRPGRKDGICRRISSTQPAWMGGVFNPTIII